MAGKNAQDQNQQPTDEQGTPLVPGEEADFHKLLTDAGLPEGYAEADAAEAARKIATDLTEFQRMKGGVPDNYDFGLPEDFQFPEGYSRDKWQPSPHFTTAIGEIARQFGIPQAAMTKFAAVYAQNEIGKNQQQGETQNAELAKLGPKGPDRIKALQQGIAGMLGKDKAAAIFNGGTADSHVALEELFQRAKGAGQMTTTQGSGRTPAKPDMSGQIGKRGGGRAIYESALRSNRT